MRPTIADLVSLGPLPSESDASTAFLYRFESLLGLTWSSLSEEPLRDDEARALVSLFGPDDAYGLAWSLLHLIETAPNWPIEDCLRDESNEWLNRLKGRAENAQRSQA